MKQAVTAGTLKNGKDVLIAGPSVPITVQRDMFKKMKETGVCEHGQLSSIYQLFTGKGNGRRYKFTHLVGKVSRMNVPDVIDYMTPMAEAGLIKVITGLIEEGIEIVFPEGTELKTMKDDGKTPIDVPFCADQDLTRDMIRAAVSGGAKTIDEMTKGEVLEHLAANGIAVDSKTGKLKRDDLIAWAVEALAAAADPVEDPAADPVEDPDADPVEDPDADPIDSMDAVAIIDHLESLDVDFSPGIVDLELDALRDLAKRLVLDNKGE